MRAFWNWLTRTGEPRGAQPLSPSDLRLTRATFRDALAGTGGEASARQRVATLASLYRGLNDDGRRSFLGLLAEEFGPDELTVNRAIQGYLDANGPGRRAAESQLRLALASPRIRIVKQFNLLHDGVKFLVDLRADVLRYLREAPQLEVLDEELSSLLSSWFDVGNLELRRISWASPAALLEKLIAYEAVHEIRSWTDLRNRLDSDRRCYAFFHPRMPDEPLIFVEIALVKDMADNIHGLLDETAPAFDPHVAQAAIFYSISNTQVGLKGVSFGGFLIKRVAEMLAADFPKLKVFATLSPVPGFRRWLDERGEEEGARLLRPAGARAALRGGRCEGPARSARAAPPPRFRVRGAAAGIAEDDAAAPLCALPRRGEGGRRPRSGGGRPAAPGPGRTLPPRQRRAARARELARRHEPAGDQAVGGADGELPLQAQRDRGAPRGVRARGPDRDGRRGEAAAAKARLTPTPCAAPRAAAW